MIVDHSKRALIGTPTKTGCTSLEFSIRYRDDVPDGIEVVHWPGAGKKPHGLLVPSDMAKYKRYMTIRHPFDRITSLYFHHMKSYHIGKEWTKDDAAKFFRSDPSFADFVEWWLDKRAEYGFGVDGPWTRDAQKLSWWLQPNIWLITLGECHQFFQPVSLIHLETYEADLKRINPYWGTMPHRMDGGADTDYRIHFKGKKRLVNKVLDDHGDYDMELLGYELEL